MEGRSNFDLSAQDWATLRGLLRQALDRPPPERAGWVDALADELSDFKPRLRVLLQHAEAPPTAQPFHTLPRIETDAFAGPAPDGAGHAAGERLGPYRLLRLLGEGGMASVWLAERVDMLHGRPIALKLPHQAWRRPGLAERMAREREILATLDHPHIARLYDAGVDAAGRPYLALEYVEGEPLARYAERHALDVRARLRLFLQVLAAVAHAHAHLVVHRDLKPSNILVGADGQAKLLDFGIAKLIAEGAADEPGLTQLGGRAFTPDYASPEQVAGRPIGTASDVYSLGVVLFELLTGHRPYLLRRDTRAALEEAIDQADPQRPSSTVGDAGRRRQLQGDLDTIVLTALRKAPGDRYPTVDAMRADIEHHLADRPVLARPDSALYRLRKFLARNRMATAATAIVAFSVLGGAGLAVWQAQVAIAERRRAEEVRGFVESIFRDADPYGESQGPVTVTALLQRARQRVDRDLADRPAMRVEMLDLIGGSLKNLQETQAAGEALDAAIDTARLNLGATHPLTLRVRVTRLGLYRFLGRHDDMQAELRELVPLLRADAGAAEPLVTALQLQAHSAIDGGRFADAVAAASDALAVSLERLGGRKDHAADSATLLALAYGYAHQPQRAKATAEQALQFARQAYPTDAVHPAVVGTRAVLAGTLGELGELAAAVEQLEQAARDTAQRLGPTAIEVAFHTFNATKYLAESGEIARAQASAAAAEATFRLHATPDSHFHAASRLRHAMTLLLARKADAARSEIEPALADIDRMLGPKHPMAQRGREDLALAHLYLGQFEPAERALRAAAPPSAAERPSWRLLHLRSLAARLQGDADTAVRLGRAALAAISGQRADIDRMRVLPNLGLSLVAAGEHAQAGTVCAEAVELLARVQTRDSAERADASLCLGRSLLALQRPADALAPLQRADAFWREMGSDGRWAGEVAYWLARCHEALGHATEAAEAATRAVAALARSPIGGDAAMLEAVRTALAKADARARPQRAGPP